MDEFNQLPDATLDGVLNELPVVPLPSGFSERVMASIQTAQRTAVPPAPIRFRLQFLDLALASFWALTLIVISLATLWWAGLFQPDWLPQAHIAFSLTDQLSPTSSPYLLAGVVLLVLELSILGLVGVNVLGDRHPP